MAEPGEQFTTLTPAAKIALSPAEKALRYSA